MIQKSAHPVSRPLQRVASTPNLENSRSQVDQSNSVKSSSFTSGGLISGIQSTPKISNIRTAPTNPNLITPNSTQSHSVNSPPQQPQYIQSPKSTTQVPLAPQFVNPKSVPAPTPSVQALPSQPQQSAQSAEPVRTQSIVQSEEERGRSISRKAENVQRLSSIKLRRTQSNRRIESRDNSGWFS